MPAPSPDIVIMDINMPDLNGIDATKTILEENPDVKVIALSIHSTDRFVKEMLKAGVSGYLVKHCAHEELVTAIRVIMKNKSYLSSQIIDIVRDGSAINFSSDNLILPYTEYFPERRFREERRSGFDRRYEPKL